MKLIQFILLVGIVSALVAYLSFFRSVLFDRVIVIALFGLALVAVLFPDATTYVANLVGVGRGTDLLVYFFALSGVFGFLVLQSRLHTVTRTLTLVVRELALQVGKSGSERRD